MLLCVGPAFLLTTYMYRPSLLTTYQPPFTHDHILRRSTCSNLHYIYKGNNWFPLCICLHYNILLQLTFHFSCEDQVSYPWPCGLMKYKQQWTLLSTMCRRFSPDSSHRYASYCWSMYSIIGCQLEEKKRRMKQNERSGYRI